MPNIATALKEEISRLSRKEIRQATRTLRRAVTQYRSDIANLKRQAIQVRSELARLARQTGNGTVRSQVPEESGGRLRFTAKGVRSHRARLGVSAADFGKLIGVTGHTIYKWEHGTARPRRTQLAAIATLRAVGKQEAVTRLDSLVAKAPSKKKRSKKKP